MGSRPIRRQPQRVGGLAGSGMYTSGMPSRRKKWPTVEEQWRAAQRIGGRKGDGAWSVDDDDLPPLYYLIDLLPPEEDKWLPARLRLSEEEAAWLRANAAWYTRGFWRDRWPAWKRALFPRGPRRATRRRYAHQYCDWNGRHFSFKSAPRQL